MNAEPPVMNVASPILIVENNDPSLPRLGAALRKAGISNRMILLPDMENAVCYLDGSGDYSDRKLHPLPGLVLLDVTLPKLSHQETPMWLTPPPVARQIVVADISGTTTSWQFESASPFGPNAFVCKLSSSESLVDMFEELRRTWAQGEKLSAWFTAQHAA